MIAFLAVPAALAAMVLSAQVPAEPLERYAVDRRDSHLVVVTHRAGLLSFLGHEHAIVPTEWSAELCLGDPVPEGAHGSLVIRTESLVIDSDSARTLAGLGGGPGEEDRRELQRKLLGPDNLDAGRFPEIRLDLVSVSPAVEGEVVVRGHLSIRDVVRDVALPVGVASREDGGVRLEGRLEVRQSHFGIEPESTAGVVKVSDEVDLRFRLVARPTGTACEGAG